MAMPKPEKFWTYDDLLSMPDDGKRYEIIDGELYEMPAPTSDHAKVVMNIIALLLPVIQRLGGRPFTAPLDIFLPGFDPVKPDVLLLFPEHLHRISKRGIEGPPDLVVEVLSPSKRPEGTRHDRRLKRALYARGGVPEYWLVSPEAAIVEVLTLEGDAYRTHVRAGEDETVTSTVLPELSFRASAAFG